MLIEWENTINGDFHCLRLHALPTNGFIGYKTVSVQLCLTIDRFRWWSLFHHQGSALGMWANSQLITLHLTLSCSSAFIVLRTVEFEPLCNYSMSVNRAVTFPNCDLHRDGLCIIWKDTLHERCWCPGCFCLFLHMHRRTVSQIIHPGAVEHDSKLLLEPQLCGWLLFIKLSRFFYSRKKYRREDMTSVSLMEARTLTAVELLRCLSLKTAVVLGSCRVLMYLSWKNKFNRVEQKNKSI